jgi:hypothetical protein
MESKYNELFTRGGLTFWNSLLFRKQKCSKKILINLKKKLTKFVRGNYCYLSCNDFIHAVVEKILWKKVQFCYFFTVCGERTFIFYHNVMFEKANITRKQFVLH